MRKTVLALAATATLIVGGGGVAFAAQTSAPTAKVYACVLKTTGATRIVTATTRCKPTERSDSWARYATAGQTVLNPQGARGETGAQGPKGDPGVGIQGPTGPRGWRGPAGKNGVDGIGKPGETGPAGAPGKNGADGKDGGQPAIYAYKVGPIWTTCKLLTEYAIAAYDCKVGQAPPKTPTPSPTPTVTAPATPAPTATP